MFKVRNKRDTGFEILRIAAIFLIILVHLLNGGGILENANRETIKWHKLLYAFFTPAVNVFVLVSAYFMVSSKVKYKKLIRLWILVVFYTLTKYLISSLLIYDDFSVLELIGCFFPIIRGKYWFFTAYFLMMLLSPFLNKILNNSSKKELYLLSSLLIVLSYLYMKHPIGEIFNLSLGYSVWWFICLYIFAGTLRLHPIKIKKRYVLGIYLLSTLSLWGLNLIHSNNYWFNLIDNPFEYTSLLVLISSISLLLLFEGVNIKNIYIHNIICYISTLTFGIYLIETGYLAVFWHFNFFAIQRYYASQFSPLWVLLVAFERFAFFAVIEMLRKFIVNLFKVIFHKDRQHINYKK